MSALNPVHQANAPVLAQIQKLSEVAANSQQAQLTQAIKTARLAAEQQIQEVSSEAKQAALDTVV